LLVNLESYKAAKAGTNGSPTAQEIYMTRKMLSLGLRVRVIEDAPLYDYDHWGRNHYPGISRTTLDDIKVFDAKFGVKAQSTTY
jgi:hypothetical protein